uniref:Uncharacterized protein n=1 Tax=Brassica oleracea var. oleracea TaxID=109376 RepID=A0A0D3BUH5_BRAOL
MLLLRFFQAAILDHLTPMMLQRLKLVNKDSRILGSYNDTNVLQTSYLFDNLVQDTAPAAN